MELPELAAGGGLRHIAVVSRDPFMPSENLDFAWDRPETAVSLRHHLATSTGAEWLRTAAWLMREARVEQVWQFLTLRQVAESFPQLSPMLGRRLPVWEHLLRSARELGRL